MQPLNRYWKICTIQTLLLPPIDTRLFGSSLVAADRNANGSGFLGQFGISTCGWTRWTIGSNGFQRFFELGRYTAATQPVAEKDLNAATQPAAKRDLKRMLLNEDDCAERVIPAARKDLSKMFEEPIHPDTSQSTNMSKHTEDFLCWKRESWTMKNWTIPNRPRRHAVVQQTANDPRLLAVAMILECKTVLKPIQRKGCIVSSLQKLQRKKRATRGYRCGVEKNFGRVSCSRKIGQSFLSGF
ncbi:hypothetical protein CEXT_193171 [Caerostris extrusa]|uniref:Uncharacterized protein n=1 Tax=Caerostris extrusa TaxID=172846 RepID=A0AAV4UWM1_CAEEX|nr:hypothetical protein CEXT_193171 [Caerostris extrusa]